jgi:hypothetical protein
MLAELWWIVPAVLGGLAVVAALVWQPLRVSRRRNELEKLRRDFHHQREHLEAHFFKHASNSGKPRGLTWAHCDFEDNVVYARDRRSGQLSAFVGVTINFEAIEGGGMEEIEFVRAPRDATAVFRVDQGRWTTDGRALMNLNPAEAVRHFRGELELVGQE